MWDYLQAWGTTPIDIGEQLAGISQPALVLTGDGDAVVPPADSERLANAAAQCGVCGTALLRSCAAGRMSGAVYHGRLRLAAITIPKPRVPGG
jgi:pimeloyl-ACP methyl ester carboxylesterase